MPVGVARAQPLSPVSAPSASDIRRSVLGLAWPSILENFLQASLGFVNTLMVSRIGAAAVAGVGTGSEVQVVFITAFFAVSLGTTVLIAHAYGAGRIHEDGDKVTKQSLVAGIILALILCPALILVAEPLLTLMGAEPDVVEQGGSFLSISAFSFPFLATMFILSGALRGVGDTRTSMLVTAGMNVINIALGYLLIFGALFIPSLGVAGAALAMVLSRGLGAATMALIVYRGRRGVTIAGRSDWRPNPRRLKRLADIGLPSMAESLLRSGGQVVFIFVVFMLGTAVTAANQVAVNAMFLSMFPGFGFALAATSLVGQALGARNPNLARAYGLTATRWCMLWMSMMGVIFFAFATPIMELAASGSEHDKIVDAGSRALRIIAVMQPVQAIGFTMAGILRGAGDTRFPMFSTSFAMWFLRVPLAYFLGITVGWGLTGIYLGMFCDTVVLMLLNSWRYRRGTWATKRIIDDDDDDKPARIGFGSGQQAVAAVDG